MNESENGGVRYVQYSKIFAGVAGIAYLIQVTVTIVLVCVYNYAASALLDILGTTTGLVGVIFGCYTGNSTVEKYIKNRALVNQAMDTTSAQTKKTSG